MRFIYIPSELSARECARVIYIKHIYMTVGDTPAVCKVKHIYMDWWIVLGSWDVGRERRSRILFVLGRQHTAAKAPGQPIERDQVNDVRRVS